MNDGTNERQSLEELLSAYADGEASPDEIRRIEALLTEDTAAQKQLAFVRALRSVPPTRAAMPLDLSARIAAATYAKPTLLSRLSSLLAPAPARYALGGALATALLAVFVLPRLPKQPDVQTAQIDQPESSKRPSVAPTTAPRTQPSPAPPQSGQLATKPPTTPTVAPAIKKIEERTTVAVRPTGVAVGPQPESMGTSTSKTIRTKPALEKQSSRVATRLGTQFAPPLSPSKSSETAGPTALSQTASIASHRDGVATSTPIAAPTPSAPPLRSRIVASSGLAADSTPEETEASATPTTASDGKMKISMKDFLAHEQTHGRELGGKQGGENLSVSQQSGRLSVLDAPAQIR